MPFVALPTSLPLGFRLEASEHWHRGNERPFPN